MIAGGRIRGKGKGCRQREGEEREGEREERGMGHRPPRMNEEQKQKYFNKVDLSSTRTL